MTEVEYVADMWKIFSVLSVIYRYCCSYCQTVRFIAE